MSNYNSNYEIAQAISERIGAEPIPFDSVYEICLQIYNELGGEPEQFDSVYEILLGILPLVEGGGSKVIDDTIIALDKTWSSSKINEEIQAVAGTANSDIEGKSTEDFHFVTELPQEAEQDEQVVIKGENTDTLYKYVSGAWVEQTPDANILYFDTENEALYSYVTLDHQFAPVSMVNTIVVGSNLNSNTALKAIKTPGVYSVVQRLHSSTKGDYIKNWTLTVEGIDYDEYERTDSVYQRIQSNYTIQKRTWSSTRATNDGWSTFSTYYAGEIKDTTTSKYYTWSSSKLNTELGAKQGALTAGQNISISGDTISAEGYVFDETKGALAEKYFDDDNNVIADNTATGLGAHAEGFDTTASGDYGAHAEGYKTQATGECSHAEGLFANASMTGAHAEGYGTTASNYDAHAEGQNTTASGQASHAEGCGHSTLGNNQALGQGAHAEGCVTIARNMGEHAQGYRNISHTTGSQTSDNGGNTAHSVGVGTNSAARNAQEIMYNGDMYVFGVGNYDGVHIKNEQGAPVNTQTLQEVIAGKAEVYEVATINDIRILFGLPPLQQNNEIWYTSTDGSIVVPWTESGTEFEPAILSNTYNDGKGVIELASDLITVPKYAFDKKEISTISLPNSVTTIKEGAFQKSKLTSIILPDNVTTIEKNILNTCTLLEYVEIPSSVTSIGRFIFSTSMKLTSIVYKGTIAQWNAITKDSLWNKMSYVQTVHCTDGDINVSNLR